MNLHGVTKIYSASRPMIFFRWKVCLLEENEEQIAALKAAIGEGLESDVAEGFDSHERMDLHNRMGEQTD